MAARWRGGFLHALLAGGAVAYTTHPTAARISAFVDTIDKAGPKLPQMEQMKETECPRCGSAKGGAANCCSGDGAWAGKCSMVAGEMEHTWAEGFAACIGAATQQQQAVLRRCLARAHELRLPELAALASLARHILHLLC